MSDHALLSPSGFDRWFRCPASVQMTRDLPEGVVSDAALEGTFAHKVFEQALIMWHVLGEEPVIRDIWVPSELVHLGIDTDEMQRELQKCLDYIVSEYENFPGDNVKISFEHKVDLHYMTNRDDLFGTCDVSIRSDQYLAVYDLKYGKGIYVEPDTGQNRLYLLGEMCPTLRETRGVAPWEMLYGMIMQPRYPDADGEFVRGIEIEPDELMDWFEDEVKPVIAQTDDPPEPIAGEKQCRFCLAKPTCPAAQKMVRESLLELGDVFQPVGEVFEDGLDADIATMDVERLIQIHDNAPFITGYLKKVAERLRTLIEERDPRLEGRYKLVVSRRNTNYIDGVTDADIIEALQAGKGRTVKDGYIPRKKFVQEKPLTASQMLKLKLNDAQKARLQEFIVKSEGSLAIVPWSDPRDNAVPPIPFEDQTKVASEQPFDFL